MSTEALNKIPKRRERHFGDRVVWCFQDRQANSFAMFAQSVARSPDRTALVFGDRSWSYGALDAEVARTGARLRELGFGQGARVAMLLSNQPAFVVLFLATQRLAAIAVPLDVRLQTDEIAHALALCGAQVLVHDGALKDRLPQLASDLSAVEIADGAIGLAPRDSSDCPPPTPPHEDDPALVLFTSGTTGRPKGAILTHLNIVHSTMNHAMNLGLAADDRSLVAVPLSHVTGVICAIMAPFWTGGTLILLPRFKAREFLEAASHWRMTYTIMVPAMYALCLRDPDFDRFDLSAWRLGHFGASPMPEETLRILAAKLPDLVLVNGYGATETCSPALMTPVGGTRTALDAGAPALPCVEVMIADPETGVEVAAGDSGELWIRGPNVSPGYWGDANATAAGFVAGYWRSGDIGRRDDQGNIVIHDRLKDVINRGGYKIYSAEVETVLRRFPNIVEVAVVGVPDSVLGERVHAVISTPAPPHEEALSAFCADRLSDYKVPESWHITAEPLPRNSMGKLDKKLLRVQAAARRTGKERNS
ncbi:MAG: Acyl-CoA synthetases (AMP-forming)/AMP-acid ligases II [Rhodobacteraceae bacterium HLUCCA12]|nr:MAG: Acyl-CoA synthetases (AMP-forming)/AMP-acid ligases II [Rhodobacteraceae bacterium HLUCCA12]